jgi:hypothetical protein
MENKKCGCIICKFGERLKSLDSQLTPDVRKFIDDFTDYAINEMFDMECEIMRLQKSDEVQL